ncbi:YHYH protein [Algibacter amylolyticus]|uniref:YHYH protein n=1 Tax=Algibacter amylolyticus TaxID=1608400 RepID=A0A5M7AXK7_9FLAO|nr:YHYH protein [Algibacter amylolyticus]KAA5821949.1 YHYH protein [Algibacter amylolyticus]MBB5269252.1 hypothetical protein [Algibacter amylolyticus]TSJ73233.1 YHYH protein [Algibacter amylolyticus]
MINRYLTICILLIVLLSCKSNTGTHSHDSEGEHSHSHNTETPINYFGNYSLINEDYGTKTFVTVSGNTRKMVTNALPNHKTGAFPNQGNPNRISAQNKTYTFPVKPKYTGEAQWIREPGIALNGVKFEPGTAEVVVCDTGENYRVEAFQDLIDLGLDFNHAHVQPTGAYHYHGSPTSVIENSDTGQDLVHVGFAHDGFPMYYSKSGAYKPSYKLLDGNREGEDCTYTARETIDVSVGGHHDGTYGSDFEYVEGYGDLDACNGININGQYMYLVTNEFPYVSRCLMGEVEQEERRGPQNREGVNRPGQRPSATDIIKQMDANKDGKLSETEAKGPLADDFSKVDANKDGFISKEELAKGQKQNKEGRQGGRPQGNRN